MSEFWKSVASEIDGFTGGRISACDFRAHFYAIADRIPDGTQNPLREKFERFHEVVADFEPIDKRRQREMGLIDEKELRLRALEFLADLKLEIERK